MPEPYNENGDETVYTANKRIQQKTDNQYYAIALHFMHYNFARIHKTLKVTPAMETAVSDHFWCLEEIARLLD